MLNADVDRYIALRRALGWKLVKAERYLHAFARHLDARGETHIRSVALLEWVAATGGTRAARSERLRILTRFARFLHAEDPRHEIQPPTSSASRRLARRRTSTHPTRLRVSSMRRARSATSDRTRFAVSFTSCCSA